MNLQLDTSDKVWLCFYYCSPIISSDLVFVNLFLLGTFCFFFFFSVGTEIDCPHFVTSGCSVCPFQLFQGRCYTQQWFLSASKVAACRFSVVTGWTYLRPTSSSGFFINRSCVFMAKYFRGTCALQDLSTTLNFITLLAKLRSRGKLTGNTHIRIWGWGEMKSFECKEQDRVLNVTSTHLDGANKIWKKFIVLAMTYWDVLRFLHFKI